MIHPDLEARSSALGGRGLFARRRIGAGTILWVFHPATTRRFEPGRDSFAHAFEDADGRLWSCIDDARLWNHSCEPTAAPCGDRDVALRDLEAGEEVTYDYGLILPAANPPLECRCGRPACRGTIGRLPAGDPRALELRERARAAAQAARDPGPLAL